jgi:hypothetical protein
MPPNALYLGQDNAKVCSFQSFMKYLGVSHPEVQHNSSFTVVT